MKTVGERFLNDLTNGSLFSGPVNEFQADFHEQTGIEEIKSSVV